MAFGVCYRYDNRPEIQNQWEFVLSNFGLTVDEVWVRGAPAEWRSYLDAPKIETADDLPAGRELILLSPIDAREVQGDVSLYGFVHPANPIYIFGADNVILTVEDDLGARAVSTNVYIPTTAHEMYSYVAGAVTLYDRMAKGG